MPRTALAASCAPQPSQPTPDGRDVSVHPRATQKPLSSSAQTSHCQTPCLRHVAASAPQPRATPILPSQAQALVSKIVAQRANSGLVVCAAHSPKPSTNLTRVPGSGSPSSAGSRSHTHAPVELPTLQQTTCAAPSQPYAASSAPPPSGKPPSTAAPPLHSSPMSSTHARASCSGAGAPPRR